jgi:hypothetical protein
MKTLSAEGVADIVQAYLDKHQPADYRLNVNRRGMEFRHDYWYVTVLPDRDAVSMWDYAHHLTQIEDEIESGEGISVLLVPTLADD